MSRYDELNAIAKQRPWTVEERDEWRKLARRRYPAVQFVRVDRTVSRGRKGRPA